MRRNVPMGSAGSLAGSAATSAAEAGLTTGLNVAFSETGIPVGSIVGALISLFGGGPKQPPPIDAFLQGNIDASGNFTYSVLAQSGAGDNSEVLQPLQAAAAAAVQLVQQLGGTWSTPVQWEIGYGAGTGSDRQYHSGWTVDGPGVGQNSGGGWVTAFTGPDFTATGAGTGNSILTGPTETAETTYYATPPMADWVARMTLGAMLLQTWPDPQMLAILGGPSQVAAASSPTGIAPTTAAEVQSIITQAGNYAQTKAAANLAAATTAAGGTISAGTALQTTTAGSSMLQLLAYGAIAFIAWDFFEGKKNVSNT